MFPVVAITQPKRTVMYVSIRGPIEVGRECDGVLLGDAQVSRRHLQLDVLNGEAIVTDLGSTNGTLLDGLAITAPVALMPGSIVAFGHSTLELVESPAPPQESGPASDPVPAPPLPAPPVHPSARPAPTLTATDPPPPFVPAPAADPVAPVAPTSAPPPAPGPVAVFDARSSIDLVATEVAQSGIDVAQLASDQGTVTIVFSDIEASTELNMQLGDQEWFHVLSEHNAIIRNLVSQYGGTEIKNRGDGFMLSFPGARMALLCMMEVQRQLTAKADANPRRATKVRIGLHTGEALVDDDGDLFGSHVVVAARIADLARGGEIMVSSLTREITDSRGDVIFGEAQEVDLKGISGSHTVFSVEWKDALTL